MVAGGNARTGPSDERLDALVRTYRQDRSESVLSELVELIGPHTYAFFRSRVGDAELAAEMNQELFVSVLKSLPNFRGDCSFRAWLFTLAHNQLSALRKRWHSHPDQHPNAPRDELWLELEPDARPGAEEGADQKQRLSALKYCLSQLDDRHRGVVIGQFFNGITLAELTERMSLLNKSGARALRMAALRRLRGCLEGRGVFAPT